jgi:predicted TIM-barrel fold metal-dependent hydrolase
LSDEILVSVDGHVMEPTDLFKTRLPKHLRDRAVWEEDLEIEPLGDDGRRFFRRAHAPGMEGWTYSRFQHFDGSPNTGEVSKILDDMDLDGITGQVMHPNLTLLWVFTDDHEWAMAHARVYNDYVIENFVQQTPRIKPSAVIPLTDIPDAVAEIERMAKAGVKAILLPAIPTVPYHSRTLDPVWEAAQANGLVVMFHVASGGISMEEEASRNMQGMMASVAQAHRSLTDEDVVVRMTGQGMYAAMVPGQVLVSLVGGGVCERYPDLHFALVEFNANWLAGLMGGMDKAWVVGIGQDPDYWVGKYDETLPADQQFTMARLFKVNDKWPYPLRPSEYVRRQIHVSFQDDPIAVATRHITGIDTLVWGSDYPHAEGTFRRSHEAIDHLFEGVDPADRAKIVGGTMAKLMDFRIPTLG